MSSPHSEFIATSRDCSGNGSRSAPPIWIPLVVLFAFSLLFRLSDFDRIWQRQFWSVENAGWPLAKKTVVQFLYHYGTWPALLVGGASALIWFGSKLSGAWQNLRPISLFLCLLLIIGPGIVVNVVFKDHFGRSRPAQATEFGGNQPFRPLGELGLKSGGKSFPSGHASMGFYWLGLFIYFWNRRRKWAWMFCSLGLAHGIIMGLGRMAQGSHWPSDILWSAGFMYLSAWGLHYALFRKLYATDAQPGLKPACVP